RRAPPSFPTRRSSDLRGTGVEVTVAHAPDGVDDVGDRRNQSGFQTSALTARQQRGGKQHEKVEGGAYAEGDAFAVAREVSALVRSEEHTSELQSQSNL